MHLAFPLHLAEPLEYKPHGATIQLTGLLGDAPLAGDDRTN